MRENPTPIAQIKEMVVIYLFLNAMASASANANAVVVCPEGNEALPPTEIFSMIG